MSESKSHDGLLRAFRSIAAHGVAPTSVGEPSLYQALNETADRMRRAGSSLERLVAHVKAIASEAGIRETHDRLVSNAVLAAIAYYYCDDIQLMASVTIETTQAFLAHDHSTATSISPEQPAAAPAVGETRLGRSRRAAVSSYSVNESLSGAVDASRSLP